VGSVELSGAASLGEANARLQLGLTQGDLFTGTVLSTALARLRTAYLRAGYLGVEVASSTAARTDTALVDVAVTVREGVRSVLSDVRLASTGETSPVLVSRTLAMTPGAAVDSVALDAAQQRLYETNIFRRVAVDLVPLEESPTAGTDRPVAAVVTLEERAPYRMRYGVQFGPSTIDSITTATDSADPGATIDVQRRNAFGQGIVLGAGAVWSVEQHRIRGTVSAPRLGPRVVSTTFTFEHADQDRVKDDESLSVIDRSAKAVLEQRWRFGRVRRVEVAYGFDVDRRRLELRATTEEPLPLRARIASLNATVTYDTRDDRFNPRRGLFHSSRIESSAGLWMSDIAFARYQTQQFVYFPLGRVTAASGVRFGSLDVDREQNPASLMLFFKTGGGSSVRGYDTDALTPGYVLGVPAGGRVLLVLNQEVRVPLTRRIGVVGFVDAGNTFEGLDTLDFAGLEVGTGGGVRLDTPVAVLRVDVGFPVPRPLGSPRFRWYFSLGQAF
jgi:translocation and assembly module TamA